MRLPSGTSASCRKRSGGRPSPASTTVRSEVEKVSTREDPELREHFGLHLLRLVDEEEEEDGPEKTRLDPVLHRLPPCSVPGSGSSR